MYILIILIFYTGHPYTSSASYGGEYHSEEACSDAAYAVEATPAKSQWQTVDAICTLKGDNE